MFNFFNNTCGNENKSTNNVNENKKQECNENLQSNNQNMATSNAIGNFDTLQKARQDLIGEIQAVIEYDNHLHSTNDKLAKETWEDIKNEELKHVGELLGLIDYLDESQQKYVQDGVNEFMDRMKRR